jgi:NAD(P)-dependent dehydrogenase (short-subunit alcohol dehydrogenase family)
MLLSQGAFVFGVDIAAASSSLSGYLNYRHHQSDLSQPASPIDAVKACAAAFGARIDVLINVAGIIDHYGSVDTLTDDIWDKVIAVDLTAPVRLMRAVVSVMLKQEKIDGERGAILNVSSRAGTSSLFLIFIRI